MPEIQLKERILLVWIPIYENDGKYYYVVPNTPSLIYRNVSQELSKILSENIFKEDCSRFIERTTS